jgi:hypothetical protein
MIFFSYIVSAVMLLYLFLNTWSGLALIGIVYSLISIPIYTFKSIKIYSAGNKNGVIQWLIFLYSPLVIGLFCIGILINAEN